MQIIPINATTFGGKLNLDDVEIGDILASSFRPHIKMKRWNGLCDMAISYPTTSIGLIQYDGVNNILRYPVDAYTDIEIFPKDLDSLNPEGAIELNVILKKKPLGNKNTITLKLETDSIDFKKILPLDVEYDQAVCLDHFPKHTPPFVITPISIEDASGEVLKTQTENLINSYEGRAKQNYHVKSELGEIKANTPNKGKQLAYTNVSRTTAHIRRGKAIDADGLEVWVEDMNLDPDGTLTITLPADFIKNAEYPIRQAVGLDPAYTEDMDYWVSDTYGDQDNTWSDYDLFTNKGVPKGAVAEIILTNLKTGTEETLGVRTDGSSLNRYVLLHEAEGGGVTTCRMFVLCDVSTGLIETYCADVTDDQVFYLVGYWENVSFTETALSSLGSSQDTWGDSYSIAANVTHTVILMVTSESALILGVRENGSSLERKVLVHEAEGGGNSIVDMMVKSNSSGIVNIYNNTVFTIGYFGEELDFVELFQSITRSASWEALDLSEYLDEDGRICDFLLSHSDIDSIGYLGVRDGDDITTERWIGEHEAEDDGGSTGEVTGFGISATTNSSGEIRRYGGLVDSAFYLMGYFKPVAGAPPYPNQFNQILYTSEPPTPNAWNQVKQEAGTGWKKLLYV